MKFVAMRIGSGIELISKTKPESIIPGMNAVRNAIWHATNWFLAAAEISMPSPSAVNRNTAPAPARTRNEPRSGT